MINSEGKNIETKKIIFWIFLWEFTFWVLFNVVLWFLDFYSNANFTGKLVFQKEDNLQYFILLLPLLISFVYYLKWKEKRFARLGSSRILALISNSGNSLRTLLRFLFLRNTIAFIIIALAQPVYGTKKVSATLETMELVLAIDVSNSMNTKDIDPETSRLEIVKRAMNQLLNNLHGERVGIVVFAGGAYLQLPITADYEAAKMYVNEIESDMVSNQGTNIANALDLASKMFSKAKSSRSILLVTDGENHEGGIEEPLAFLKENKISLAILGIGTNQGGQIPIDPYRKELGYKKDATGVTIVSKLNPSFLKNLASKANAYAVISSSPFPNLDKIVSNLKHMKREKVDGMELDIQENWYQIPLLLAMINLLLYVLPFSWKFSRREMLD